MKVLGRGAFGKVMLVKEIKTDEIFALKALRKDQLIDKEQTEHTKVERQILIEAQSHPFLVGMKYCFQDEEKVFFVMQFMKYQPYFHKKPNTF